MHLSLGWHEEAGGEEKKSGKLASGVFLVARAGMKMKREGERGRGCLCASRGA